MTFIGIIKLLFILTIMMGKVSTLSINSELKARDNSSAEEQYRIAQANPYRGQNRQIYEETWFFETIEDNGLFDFMIDTLQQGKDWFSHQNAQCRMRPYSNQEPIFNETAPPLKELKGTPIFCDGRTMVLLVNTRPKGRNDPLREYPCAEAMGHAIDLVRAMRHYYDRENAGNDAYYGPKIDRSINQFELPLNMDFDNGEQRQAEIIGRTRYSEVLNFHLVVAYFRDPQQCPFDTPSLIGKTFG